MVAPVQPSSGDIAYLKAHPEVADKFNARFGPNAADRFIGQVTSTVTPPEDVGIGADIVQSGARAGAEMLGGTIGQLAASVEMASPYNLLGIPHAIRTAGDVAGKTIDTLGLSDVASYEPQTIPGKAVYYGLPYAPVAAGGWAAGRALPGIAAALLGAGTEAASTEGLGLPPIVGSLAGGAVSMAAGGPMMFRRPDARLAADAIRDIPERRISDAIALQRQSVGEGVPLMAPEALNEPGVIGLADAVATYPGAAGPMQAVAREREMLARRAIENKLNQTGPADVSPGAATTELTDAANKIIGAETDARTQAAQTAGYKNLPNEAVDPTKLSDLVSQVDATIAQTAGLTGLKPLLQKFRAQLFESDGKTPITNAAYLESAYKQLREGLNRRTSGPLVSPDDAISAEDAGKVGPLIDQLQEILKTAPSYEPGRSTFEDISRTVVDPLKERLEPVIGASGWKQLRTVMLSPDSLTAKELTPLLQTIETKTPSAIPNIARVIFERAYDAAFRRSTRHGGAPVPAAPANFAIYLRKTAVTREKFEAVVSSVARSQGQKPDIVVRGWNRLLDVLERTGVMPDIGSRTEPRSQIHAEAQKNITQVDVSRPLTSLRFLGIDPERLTGSLNMKRLGRILASENGVQGLVDLANTKPNTARAAYIVNALLQTARVIENPGTEQ